MFIKSNIPDVSSLVHDGVSYAVVNGIADVPKEVRDANVSFPHWSDATEEVDKKTITALAKANKADEPKTDTKE